MLKNTICFLVRTPLTKRDYDRFGIELIRRKGCCVYVLDLTLLLNPQYLKQYTPENLINDENIVFVESRGQFVEFLKEKGKDILVVDILGANYSNLFIYRDFKKYGIIYASFCANTLPLPQREQEKKFLKRFLTKFCKMFSSRAFQKFVNFFKIILFGYICSMLQHIGYIKSPEYMLVGGTEISYQYPLPNVKTKMIKGHTLDYDFILKEKIVPYNTGYAVFIDEYVPYHPDFIISKMENIDADSYYGGLKRFFDWFEGQFKQKIVIAAHPRSYYDDKPMCYGNRKIIKGKTAETIAGSSCVLTHESTAVSFAVCFKKPLLFLTCDEFERTFHGPGQRILAGQFGKKPVNVDRPFDSMKLDFANHNLFYDRYFERYIKYPGSPEKLFWEIVVDELMMDSK